MARAAPADAIPRPAVSRADAAERRAVAAERAGPVEQLAAERLAACQIADAADQWAAEQQAGRVEQLAEAVELQAVELGRLVEIDPSAYRDAFLVDRPAVILAERMPVDQADRNLAVAAQSFLDRRAEPRRP